MNRKHKNTISDFQQELMVDLKKRYSKTNKQLTPDEINEYIFMFSDILLYGGTKKKKTKKIKNIKIIGSHEFLFKSKKQKTQAAIYVNNYSSILREYIEGGELYEGGAAQICDRSDPLLMLKPLITALKGRTRLGYLIKTIPAIGKIISPWRPLLDKDHIYISGFEQRLEQQFANKGTELAGRAAMGTGMSPAELAFAKNLIHRAMPELQAQMTDAKRQALSGVARALVTSISAVLFSLTTEVADTATEFVGGFVPIEPALSELESIFVCDPAKAVLLIGLLLPSVKREPVTKRTLSINLSLVTASNFMCEGCGGQLVADPSKHLNEKIRKFIEIIGKYLVKATRKLYNINVGVHKTLHDSAAAAGRHRAAAVRHVAAAEMHIEARNQHRILAKKANGTHDAMRHDLLANIHAAAANHHRTAADAKHHAYKESTKREIKPPKPLTNTEKPQPTAAAAAGANTTKIIGTSPSILYDTRTD